MATTADSGDNAPQRRRAIRLMRTSTVSSSLRTFCLEQMKHLQEQGYAVTAVSSDDADLQVIADSKIATYPVSMKRHISPLHDAVSLYDMLRALRAVNPDIVHSITPKAGLLTMLAARLTGVPVRVHTFTGLIWPTRKGLKRKILKLTDRLLCACATHIVAEGQGVRDDLVSAGITRKPVRVLGNGNLRGIDPDHYGRTPGVCAQAAALRDGKVFTFLFVGRVTADKGIAETVEAFMRVHRAYPATRLVIVGDDDGGLDPVPEDTRLVMDSHPAIMAVGHCRDVRPWMAAADALVFASHREGFPNVVLEAGAMSLPAVVTDINGSREIIVNGHNGLVVPVSDADALTAAMTRLVTDRDLTARMAAVARRHVLERWSADTVTRALLDFYDEILPHR